MKAAVVLALVVAVLAKKPRVPNGTELYMYNCNASNPAQVWTFAADGSLQNKLDGKCLDVADWSTSNGADIHMWDCHPTDRPENQQWTMDRTQQWAPILSKMNGKACVDIEGVTPNEGGHIHLWEYLGTQDNQLWHYNADGTIVSKMGGHCITSGYVPPPPPPTCKDASISGYPYCDATLPAEKRMADLQSRMTQEEKLSLVRGYGGQYVGDVNANLRLGIPYIYLEDGPQGVADGVTQVTCWPSALTVISSWDRSLMNQFGSAMAEEQATKGTNVLLGPMNNLARVPVGGRNFESTGEDPALSSAYSSEVVKGIQAKGVIACSKHFADNNQEYDRTTVSAIVDERTQWELYYPQFQAAVDAGVGSIMCSYNLINGLWACENEQTLTKDLKQKMGFKGYVMSDWGATHSTVKAANAGLDMQMPDDEYFGAALSNAIAAGQVPQSRLEDMVTRIVTPMFQLGMFETANTGTIDADARSDAHNLLARTLAEQSAVLVKNSGRILPLSSASGIKIAVLGKPGKDSPVVAGGGSGSVIAPYIVTPFDGIKARAGASATVTYNNGADTAAAAATAKAADVAVVVVSTWSSEGGDRSSLALDGNQDALVSAVVQAQPKTIVVVHCPGAVLMPWSASVPAILVRFMPGQEDGNALASLLWGDVVPSGKLPVTFPVSDSATWLTSADQYPGINDVQHYSERLLVGYRWAEATNAQVLWPFGHGLSYTSFSYSGLTVSSTGVSFTLNNTGPVAAAEVAQVYIGYPASAGEPPKNLRNFAKVSLSPAKAAAVTLPLSRRDISIWDVNSRDWVVLPGTYTVFVGSSSRDIRLQATFTV
jgi:beta-glucosidase